MNSWKIYVGLLLTVMVSKATADDIEIYTGSPGGVASNAMLVLDTSRSMEIWAIHPELDVNPRPPYNAETTYESAYEFNAESYYLVRQYDAEDRFISGDTWFIDKVLDSEVTANAIECDEATSALQNTGVFNGKLKYWHPTLQEWDAPSLSYTGYWLVDLPEVTTAAGSIVECESPQYTYGGSTYNYLSKNNSFPYTDQSGIYYQWFIPYRYDQAWGTYYYTQLYSGNYLNYLTNPNVNTQALTRYEVASAAIRDVIDSTSGVNIGLMRFSSDGEGGMVKVPIGPIEEVRADIHAALDEINPIGSTPLEETFHEAFQYFSGSNLIYGDDSRSEVYDLIVSRNTDPTSDQFGITNNYESTSSEEKSDSESYSGSNYIRPDALECTASKIILFSDGEPTNDDQSNGYIRNLLADSGISFPSENDISTNCSGNGACAEELAYLLANSDHRPDIDGIQNITVDTFGGFLQPGNARNKLINIAAAGDGTYYEGADYQSIREGLQRSLSATITSPSTFTSPTVAVNSFNSLETSDQVYYTVFEPAEGSAWAGNLKRYRLAPEGIVDAEGNPAVDPNTGFFDEGSKSYWSLDVDGNQVKRGGAASRLSAGRNIYYTSTTGLVKLPTELPSTAPGIPLDLLKIDDTSALVTDDIVQLTNWIAGYNADGTVRTEIEDPLHSRPIIINYGQGDSTAFISTNSGYLHAISTNEDNPEEHFAIITKELLPNAQYYYRGDSVISNKRYGLDGALTYFHDDKNYDGVVNNNDRVILYVGMRRGGHSYYAFDVTDRSNPALVWQINGNYPADYHGNAPATTPGFENLGQTWSALVPGEIRIGGTKKVVLFAGGGYDRDQDGSDITGPTTRTSDDVGNTIYIIDAITGEKIWDARQTSLASDMQNSFPADLIPIDSDGNGLVDRIYAADVGGRVWRVDLNEDAGSASDLMAVGGVMADLADGNGIASNRRFFNAPDISLQSPRGALPFIVISIGSGYRAHPLNTQIEDYHYLIKDNNPFTVPTSIQTITKASLKPFGTTDAPSSQYGWYQEMSRKPGEKILSTSLTLDSKVLVTSFAPNDASNQVDCYGDTGNGRLYVFDLSQPETEVEVVELEQKGIPPGPIVPPLPPTTTDESDPGDNSNSPDDIVAECEARGLVAIVGAEQIAADGNGCSEAQRSYWKEL